MNDLPHKPIKRSPYLTPLSREHHEGLLLAWKIQQGTRKGVEIRRIVDYCEWFFREFLFPHFKMEEQVFSKILDENEPMLLQMIHEHRVIEKALSELPNETVHAEVKLLEFGTLLQLHIRFEERFLFNLIESKLSKEELELLDVNPKRTLPAWQDVFWL